MVKPSEEWPLEIVGDDGYHTIWNYFEVIGNIYENPELLEVKK